MCGIAGFFSSPFSSDEGMAKIAAAMTSPISHRGPDDSGVWTDCASGIALAHRRLAIVDLSASGHQPMVSPCGRYFIVFNGEIYNHLEIRKSANGIINWHGHSDTETLLYAIAQWGVKEALSKCVGMFAFALWDNEAKELHLARDRLGEKPLYYGFQNGSLIFGSELKALRDFPGFENVIDRASVSLMLKYGNVPAPHSIYKGIYKLNPGSFVTISVSDVERQYLPTPTTYWSLRDVIKDSNRYPVAYTDVEAVDKLEYLLRRSISEQMIADVPLGAFLSGGIDSSTVVSLMQSISKEPIKTFSIGFNEPGYNEAEHALAVSAHLGTEHTELYVTAEQAMSVIPNLAGLYDEPFGDASQVPTFLVSQLASRHVTVCLSGDGGDELFGGYNRHVWGASLWRNTRRMPKPLRAAVAAILVSLPPASWDKIFNLIKSVLPENIRFSTPGDKLHKLAPALRANNPFDIYMALISSCNDPTSIVIEGALEKGSLFDPLVFNKIPDFEHCMMYMDSISYLPNDVLTKVDRAAMGVSLETRVPFLDYRLVEFAWELPLSMKIRQGQGKWIVRELLNRFIPSSLIDRPKMGFSVPIDSWLRGPLKLWAEDLINEERLISEGYLRPKIVRDMWSEHISGRRNWAHSLWNILMFQLWLDSNQN